MTGITLTSSPKTLTGSYSYVYGPAKGTYSVINLGTVIATGNNFAGAIYLKLGGSVTNGSASATSQSITGYGTNAGVAIVGAPGTVTNWGTIDGGSAQRGVRLYDGGTLVNGSPTDTTAIIRGHGLNNAVGIAGTTMDIPSGGGGSSSGNGIVIPAGPIVTTGSISDPPAGLVINYGTIGNSDDKAGVAFGANSGVATVINGSTADTVALIASGAGTTGTGVYIGAPVGGSIENFATIGSTTSRTGIYLGTVAGAVNITNGSTTDTTALITGGASGGFGIVSKDPGGRLNVANFGTISATSGTSIYLLHGGTVTNGSALDTTAVIKQAGAHANVYVKYGVGTVTNFGTIGDSAGHSGVSFGSSGGSGTIVNGSTADTTALIVGGSASGPSVYFGSPLGGVVINFATIGGPNARTGVYLAAHSGGVKVTNGSPTDTTALITGATGTASALFSNSPSGPIDLLNYAIVQATAAAAINLGGGGTITNGSTLDTAAVIRSAGTHSAVYVSGGLATVANFGTIGSGTGATAVAFAGNSGTGVVINGSTADETALLTGGAVAGSAISSSGGTPPPLDVQNFGIIAATAAGAIAVEGGGTVINGSVGDTNAVIRSQGTHTAVYTKTGLTTVVNFGTLTVAAGDAVLFATAGGTGTVVNAGTIESATGDAIAFRSPGGKVVADPGAVFGGNVVASAGGATVLELAAGAGLGALGGIGTNFAGFSNVTVDTGANWDLTGANTLNGGQTLTVAGTLSATNLGGVGNVALAGGTADFGSNLGTFIPIGMVASTVNTLIVSGGDGGTLANTIGNLAIGDRIEVAGVTFDSGTLSGPALDLTDGGTSVFTLNDIGFAGNVVPRYSFGTDGTTGNSFVQIACFAEATRILTAAGELPVEELRPGMLLPSLTHGRPLRAVWIGHRQLNCATHPRPREVWPVRIAAHAFGADLPHRDLYLSPDHAVALPDGSGGSVLIPARYLVNGVTIVQQPLDNVCYYHVELERHGVLLAEGLATESYLDTGNRCAFANGGALTLAHPDFSLAVWDSQACAPLVLDGPLLEQARAMLLRRACELGFALTAEAELMVLAGDCRVPATPLGESWFEAVLPPNATEALLISRTMVPSEVEASPDCRQLGIGAKEITLDGAPVALDDARLLTGWHAPEPDLRWTDGRARIALAGARVLRVRVAAHTRYWARPDVEPHDVAAVTISSLRTR